MVELKDWDTSPHGVSFRKYFDLIQEFGEKYEYHKITFISQLESRDRNDVASVYAEGRGGQYLMLKFGKSEDLEQEKIGLKLAVQCFDLTNDRHLEIIANGDYYCLPIKDLDESTTTFSEFYSQSTDTQSISGIISKLFYEKIKIFDNLHKLKETGFEATCELKNVFHIYTLNDTKIIQELKEINLREEGQGLLNWWNEQKKISKRKSYSKIVHGNLHSNNIIIKNNAPELIDFSKTCTGHVLMDFAKLECDIKLYLEPTFGDADFLQLDTLLDACFNHSIENDQQVIPKIDKAYNTIKHIRETARLFALGSLNMSEEEFEFDYCVALFVQNLLFASSPYDGIGVIPKRRPIRQQALKNARLLKERITELIYDSILWKVAYSFLRLDQLPVGGWSRSLPGWLRAAQLKIGKKIPHSGAYEDLREKGGVNITGEAFIQYSNFINRCLGFHFSRASDQPEVAKVYRSLFAIEVINQVGTDTRNFLEKRIGIGGGIDVVGQGELVKLTNQIHHTLLAAVVLFYYELSTGKRRPGALNELEKTLDFLLIYLKEFKEQGKDRIFGTYTAAVLLKYLIESNFFSTPADFNKEVFLNELNKTIDGLLKYIGDEKDATGGYFFHPNSIFQRSDFLMQFSFLMVDDEAGILARDEKIRNRISDCLEEMIEEIDIIKMENGLIKFIKGDEIGDFGSSAKLATYLNTKSVRDLLKGTFSKNELLEKSNVLKKGLQKSILDFNQNPENFYFTHGVSFSYYLNLIKHKPLVTEIENLDRKVNLLLNSRVTESGIVVLLKSIFSKEFSLPEKSEEFVEELNIEKNNKDIYKLFVSIKNLLLSKLESGAYTFKKEDWEQLKNDSMDSTFRFFQGELGIKNAEANSNNKNFREFLYKRLAMYVNEIPKNSYVMDIGCGKGDFAAYFLENGLNVHIIDYSKKMLTLTEETIKKRFMSKQLTYKYKTENVNLKDFTEQRNFEIVKENLGIGENHYQMIFADGIIFHLPQENIGSVFKRFYSLLGNGGILFVNFKINDHTLISFDGRFFEYYPDHTVPLHWLNMAGFKLKEVIITEKSTTMYGKPLFTQWAHYFCIKEPLS